MPCPSAYFNKTNTDGSITQILAEYSSTMPTDGYCYYYTQTSDISTKEVCVNTTLTRSTNATTMNSENGTWGSTWNSNNVKRCNFKLKY
jgi:hypothetical protein